ncbi:MAG: AAA family ATPase [Firmicutes bacterium]|nr:AAA family ATPase [Bacillota bacterium]
MDKQKQEEVEVLKRTYNQVREYVGKMEARIDDSVRENERYFGDIERIIDYQYNRARISDIKTQIRALNDIMESMYFGRIDFVAEGKDIPERNYITTLPTCAPNMSDVCDISIIDWRSPIGSLYYSRDDKYVAPEGVIRGKLKLVRKLDVRHDELLNMEDLYVQGGGVSSANRIDLFLERHLRRSGAERFKGIVQSIQAEQNEVIRQPFDNHLVIQGAAGTGKTVVLLHRVAYCVYATGCKPEDILVLSPSEMLLSQIRGILPEMYIYGVPQMTLTEFFNANVGKNNQNIRPNSVNVWRFAAGVDFGKEIVNRYSDTALLDQVLKQSLSNAINALPVLKYDKERIIDASTIRKLAANVLSSSSRIDEIYNELHSRLKAMVFNILWPKYSNLKDRIFGNFFAVEKKEMYKKVSDRLSYSYIKDNLKSENLFQGYIVPQYRKIAQDLLEMLPDPSQAINDSKYVYKRGGKYNSANHPKWTIDDLGALLYLHAKVYGVERHYSYIFIDEAQNLSPVWLKVLSMYLKPGGSITLCGDIVQLSMSVYGNISNQSWQQRVECLGSNVSFTSLSYCYRSAEPIVNMARWVLEERFPAYAEKLRAVLPSDAKVVRTSVDGFLNFVRINNDIQRVAIICPSQEEANRLKQQVGKVDDKEVFILSVHESGGLEFDAVLVAKLMFYDRRNPFHARALYTAISRATHYLFIEEK